MARTRPQAAISPDSSVKVVVALDATLWSVDWNLHGIYGGRPVILMPSTDASRDAKIYCCAISNVYSGFD
jgi:hypothetical protein